MCGIAGFMNCTFLDRNDLQKMTDVIAHRGPDGEGFFADKDAAVGLGHRRLAIIDPSSAGHQPMTYEDSGYWITFNGEIYNYIELKEELKNLGYVFYTMSDTEVLLVAYIAWGKESFKKLNGMFAFAIYNQRNHELLVCRDRYGVKPLYYWQENNSIVFGSELKVFAAVANKLKLTWDTKAIYTNLVSEDEYNCSGFSLLKNVKVLSPGYFIVINKNNVEIKQWWSTKDNLISVPKGFSDQIEQFQYLLTDACRIRLRSDMPVGISLSGGLDSSSILTTLKKLGYSPKAFNLLFENKFFDEGDYVKVLAAHNKIECVYVANDDSNVDTVIDDAVYYDENFPPALLPGTAAKIFSMQRQHGFKVTIDGHGADEMLAGYYWYLQSIRKDSSLFSKRFYQCLKQEIAMIGYSPRYFYIKEIFMKLKLSWLFDKFKYFNATPWDPIPFIKKVGFSIYQTREIDIPSDWSQLQKCLYHNFHLSALPSILRDFDLRSMRYGVEMRTPFLDYRLVNFCFSLPDTSKVDKGYSKIILREAMKGALPDVVRTRKQKVPFRNNQAKNSLSVGSRQWIEHTLEDKNPLEEFISTAEMKKFYYESVLSDSHTNNLSEKFCACLNAMRLLNIFKEKFDFS